MNTNKIITCLWFDHQAEEAAKFYVSIFRDAHLGKISKFENDSESKKSMVMTVEFSINGQMFLALNGGSMFKFTEAISFQIFCETQDEIDEYWSKLTIDGEEQQCGWLKDKYGLSWQIIPSVLPQLLAHPEKSDAVTKAFLKMKKFDIATLMKA